MKKTLLTLALIASTLAWSQKDVYLNINHYLGSNTFTYDAAATNNLGNVFNVKRLEYYIAEIEIIHDGGQSTTVPSTWLLVDAGSPVNTLLGNYSITQIEAIRLGIGVEYSHNHLDPSTYPASHPLAPKSPSMHWGWTSGYRFIAMEGDWSSALNQDYEFHALGDGNYYQMTINTTGMASGNDLIIALDADYENAFFNIDLTSGNNIVHGETGKAKDLIHNFNNYVFTSSDGNQSIGIGDSKVEEVSLFPNPTSGNFTLSGLEHGSEIRVMDLSGREVLRGLPQGSTYSAKLDISGVYLLQIFHQGSNLKTLRLVISN